MSGKVPTVDVHEADVARFYPSSRTTGFARARAAEAFNKMYGIVHPAEQYESLRPLRTGPLYGRAKDLGAVFYETARWERPHWYASNEPLLEKYAGRLMERPPVGVPLVVAGDQRRAPGACATAPGWSTCPRSPSSTSPGPAPSAGLQRLAVAQLDVPVGRTVYTPFLNEAGKFVADLTIMRLGASSFRVVTGAADGGRDAKWISDRLPDTRSWPTSARRGPRSGCGGPARATSSPR